ncbi:MAG: Rnf-Nqr domain containing protein [Pseudomonadales bacterium]|nr:Rnf-Nqr domain containing protein [Pseudomonadales bacterium]
MSDFLLVTMLVIASAAVINNVVLLQLLGTTSLLTATENPRRSYQHGVHTTLLLVLTTGTFHLASILLPGFSTEALLLPVYLCVLLPFLAMLSRLPGCQNTDLILLAGNTAILGPIVITSRADSGVLHSLFYALGTGLGFLLVLLVFAAMQERVHTAAVPAPFRGAAISLINAGLMSLGFMGLAGIV